MKSLYTFALLLALPCVALAQQSYALKPYAITMPQVNAGGQWQYLLTNSNLANDYP